MVSFIRHIRALLCALCLLVCASAQTANVYPISLTASLLPPYSNCLGDYMSGSMDRVNVMAVMKDMSNPTGVYDIQLRMVVRQGNTRYIEASAKPHNSVTFSVARDGRMKRLSNAGRLLDPANASISYSRYAKNGYCLPEGAYQIEFQAFDNRFPTLPLSEPYTLHVYLGETEPPVPVYPANNTCVPNTSGQITFSWMERTVPHISPTKKYRLQVFEVPAGAATNAVAVSEPYKRVDEVVGGTTTFATIQQTAGTFVSGHTYVWRVRSFDDADKDNNTSLRYKNQGWSDTASFRFDRCLDEGFGIVEAEGECDDLARPAIAGVETSADAALVEWTADSGSATPPDLFRIAYCLAGDSLGLWTSFDKHTGDLATLAGTGGTTVYALPLRGLEPGVAYRVRVCAVRSGADGTAACHSEADSAEFRMPLAAGTVLADCDRSVPALQCTTALTKENAPKAGDHINANGQDVKILSIEAKGEGADTRFSGQGTTTFPFLKNKLSLLVDFRDIQISCANELMKGEIVTHWDPDHNANLDFNALLNNNNMGTGPAPQQEWFTSGDTATLKSGIAYVEKGANTGDVYAVGADGKVEKVGESLECTGVSTSALDYEAGTVVFSSGDGQLPPFDRNSGKFQNADIRNYYTRYGTYDVPWVAVVSGKTATLRASFNANTDGTPVDTSKIYFVCKTQYQTVKLKSRNLSGGQYEVTVFGDKPQERLDIYAMCADTSGNCLKALTLGKALVMTMAQRRETLVLVPVGQNAPKVDTAAIKRTLDGIYLPLGVDYTVRADKPFYTSELDGLLEEGLGITGAGLFKEETDDMRYLQSLYRQERGDSIDNTAAYIFILPKASVDGVKGDMPLTRPVGYVFASGDTYADGQTIAHELGHGLYSFQHAFDYMGVSQGETDNLMDYGLPQGEHLAVWQWNLISTHKNYTVPFLTDEEDGWIKSENGHYIYYSNKQDTAIENNFELFESLYSEFCRKETTQDLIDTYNVNNNMQILVSDSVNRYLKAFEKGKTNKNGVTFGSEFEMMATIFNVDECKMFFIPLKDDPQCKNYAIKQSNTKYPYLGNINNSKVGLVRTNTSDPAYKSRYIVFSFYDNQSNPSLLVMVYNPNWINYKDFNDKNYGTEFWVKKLLGINESDSNNAKKDKAKPNSKKTDTTQGSGKSDKSQDIYDKSNNKKKTDTTPNSSKSDKLEDNGIAFSEAEVKLKLKKITEAAEEAVKTINKSNEERGQLPTRACCNMCVRNAFYRITGSELLYPKNGSDIDDNITHKGRISEEGLATDIYNDFTKGNMDDYFEKVTKKQNESWKDFLTRVQDLVNKQGKIVIGIKKDNHVFMVVPGNMFKTINNTHRVKKSGKRYIMRKEYEKERDAYKGDIYSFSFVNRTEYVNRILECGPNVKNADCPLWANMAGNLLDQISFWVYKK